MIPLLAVERDPPTLNSVSQAEKLENGVTVTLRRAAAIDADAQETLVWGGS